jgi:hypothetical protein
MSKMTRAEADVLLDQVAKRLAEFKQLEDTFGTEPDVGAMLRINRVLNERSYTYAAIRADNGLWYVTGRDGAQARTWDELIDVISGWTLKHYEIVPPPAAQVLPADAVYPCGHTDADHDSMFSNANGSPLSFEEFIKKFPPPPGVQFRKVGSLAELFGEQLTVFDPGADSEGEPGYSTDEPLGANDPDAQ